MAKETTRNFGISAAKGTLIYTMGQIIGSAAVLLLLIILARLLKPVDFGLYAIAVAFYTLLSIGGHFGMGTALRKRLPQILGKKDMVAKMISNAYAVALATGLVVSIAAVLASGLIARNVYHDPALEGTLALAAMLVFFYALFNITLAALVAVDKIKEGTVMYLVYAFVQLFSSVALVMAGYGILGAIIGLGIGLIIPSIIGLFWIAGYINFRFQMPDKATAKSLMGFSAPVVASNVAVQAPPNLAILLLGIFTTAALVGNYNAAYKFGNFVGVFLISNSFILLPFFARAFSDKNLSGKIGRIYNGSIYYTLLLLLPLLIYFVSVSQPLIYLLFSRAYAAAPLYFAVIALGTAMGIVSIYAGNLIISYGDTKKFMKYQLLAVALQIILLAVLTPMLKAYGVLLALFIVSPIMIDFMYINALHRQFSFRQDFGQIFRIILPALILMALLYGVAVYMHQSDWALLVNLAGTALLFPPLAVLFGGIKTENVNLIRDISKSIRMGKPAGILIRYVELFINAKRSRN
jgi:O-antigen/teichoic acid export membrane protein